MNRTKDICLRVGIGLAAILMGCQAWPPKEWSQPAAPATSKPAVEAMNPCAERLQDICGPLLLYYKTYDKMPDRLEDLGKLAPGALPPLVCPKSGIPYVNNPRGLAVPNSDKRIVVYDAAACHDGKRWTIVVDPPKPGKPLVARVEQVDDSRVFSSP